MKIKIALTALILILFLILAGITLADNDLIPRWVLSGGATESAGNGVALNATLGQPVVGLVSGGDVTLGQGFWYGNSALESRHVYLPFIHK